MKLRSAKGAIGKVEKQAKLQNSSPQFASCLLGTVFTIIPRSVEGVPDAEQHVALLRPHQVVQRRPIDRTLI